MYDLQNAHTKAHLLSFLGVVNFVHDLLGANALHDAMQMIDCIQFLKLKTKTTNGIFEHKNTRTPDSC